MMGAGGRGSFVKAVAALQKAIDTGVPGPTPAPKMLPLKGIRRIEDVFQQRVIDPYCSARHVTSLKRALARDSETRLPPVVVFWIGDGYVCIDGHHRLDAYGEVGQRGGIPVNVFQGTLRQATLQATAGNSRDKLLMSEAEKMDAAWRYVCCGTEAYSKAEIVKATAVSPRSVANMRGVWNRAVEEQGEGLDELTWWEARRGFDGKDREAFDEDAAATAMAQTMARAFPDRRLTRDPDVTISALRLYAPEMEWSCRRTGSEDNEVDVAY